MIVTLMTTSKPTAANPKFLKWAIYIIGAIIILLPFHAFLTVWLSSIFGHYTALRLWKEVLLFGLVAAATYVLIRDTRLRREFVNSRLNQLILAYAALTLIWGVAALELHKVTAKALGFGLVVNLRFLAFFLVVWVFANKAPKAFADWPKWLFLPLGIVLVFGLLQYLALPYDFLRHFDYGESTIYPYETINHNVNHLRVFSTLRGANPLGAYLLLTLSLLAILWRKQLKSWRGVLLAAGVFVLFLTFSRSALIGAMLSAAILVWCSIRSEKTRRWAVYATAASLIVLGGLALALRNNTTLQDLAFHTNDKSTIKVSSNDGHATALHDGVHDIARQPLGEGVGSAGPASVYAHKTRIAENYFIQVGQETGWVGLILFLLINVYLALGLWARRQDPLALGLFAALIGLSFVNLLSHAWTDDTLAYIFWGLAAIAVAQESKTNHVKVAS
jgi:hypothetical protein